jgi:hypothetical protein
MESSSTPLHSLPITACNGASGGESGGPIGCRSPAGWRADDERKPGGVTDVGAAAAAAAWEVSV